MIYSIKKDSLLSFTLYLFSIIGLILFNIIACSSPEVKSKKNADIAGKVVGIWTFTQDTLSVDRVISDLGLLNTGEVIVVGGYSSSLDKSTNTCEIYDPATSQWHNSREPGYENIDLPVGVNRARPLFLDTGKREDLFLLFGGTDDKVAFDTIYAFDPVNRSWRVLGRMQVPRFNLSVARLKDGRVLIIGGEVSRAPETTLASAEIFDPATGACKFAKGMNVPRGDGEADRS